MDMLMPERSLEKRVAGTALARVAAIMHAIQELIAAIEVDGTLKADQIHQRLAKLASDFNGIVDIVQKMSDGKGPRRLVITPIQLSPLVDEKLQIATQGRVAMFNHAVPPDYLRTKPDDAVVANERANVDAISNKSTDIIIKQVTAFNKHIETMTNIISELGTYGESHANPVRATYNPVHTQEMLKQLNRFDKTGR